MLAFLLSLDLGDYHVDIVGTAGHERASLLEPGDRDVQHGPLAIRGLTTRLLNQEGNWENLVDELEAGGVRHGLKHRIDALAFHKELITIHCEGS